MHPLTAIWIVSLVSLLCSGVPTAGAQPPRPVHVSTNGSVKAGASNWRIYLPYSTNEAAPATAFGYGVQADPGSSASANIGHIHALGFGWTKFQMPWEDVEPNPGDYRWASWDALIGAYNTGGVKVLLSVVKAPAWARPANTDFSVEGPPADPQTYADFLRVLLTRYKGKVQAIEVWSEQNLWYEWGHEPIDAARYVTLLCRAYGAIKDVDPSVVVVSGAPTPTGANDGNLAVDDQVYVQQMYAAGAKGCFDGLGAHPGGYNNPPDATLGYTDPVEPTFKGHRSFLFRATLEGYRSTMVANGDAARTVWATEFGWASDPAPLPGYDYARDNTLDEQAAYSVRAYEMARSWGWVGAMFLWNLDYGVTAPNTPLAYFSLLRPDPVPAYASLAAMPK